MTTITRIDAQLKTGSRVGAGTDGDVYLGIGGREFFIDSAVDDFEAGADRVYTFGAGSNVSQAFRNDPRSPYQLLTENLGRFPVYVRFVPGAVQGPGREDDWNLESITVTVNPGAGQFQFQALGGSDHLILSRQSGLSCHLVRL